MCPAISSAVTTRERRTRSRTTCPSRRCLAGQKTTPECLISTRRSLHSIGLAAAAGQKPLNGLRLQPRRQCVIVSNILVDQASVVVVIRQGRIDICERQMRKRTHDLVGRPPLLGPEDNVLNSNSRSRNSGLSPARARGRFDVAVFRRGHHTGMVDGRRSARKVGYRREA